MDPASSLEVFRTLWAVNLAAYLFVTLSTFSFDPQAARGSWVQGFAFPGLISLLIILVRLRSPVRRRARRGRHTALGRRPELGLGTGLLLFAYVWLAASMLAAYLMKIVAGWRWTSWSARPLLYVVGFGPLLCSIAAAAYLEEARGSELVWEKTEKLGAVGAARVSDDLDRDVAAGERFERALVWRALVIVLVIAAVVAARALWG